MKKIEELGISPTPWHIGSAHRCVYDDGGYIVHNEPLRHGLPYDRRKANTRLIAAAPKLYAALYDILLVANNRLPTQPTLEEIEAVRKAKAALAEAVSESEVAV